MFLIKRILGFCVFLQRVASLEAQTVKNSPAMQETQDGSLVQDDPLREMAAHSSILAWRIPWTEDPGRLQSTGSQRLDTTKQLTLSLSQREAEDEMVGWHFRLNEREFEQTPGDREGQGSLVRCSPWGHKELDTTE